jgi:hypothetical protein
MPVTIRTLEGSEIDTGFMWGDLEQVHIAEDDLPPLTITQFLGYAATALCDKIIPALPHDLRTSWAPQFASINESVQPMTDRPRSSRYYGQDTSTVTADFEMALSGSTDDRLAFYDGISASWRSEEAEYYVDSPFAVSEDGQVVKLLRNGRQIHSFESFHLLFLTHNILHGGFMGWQDNRTFPEVRMAAAVIHETFRSTGEPPLVPGNQP